MIDVNKQNFIKLLRISFNNVNGPDEKIIKPTWEQVEKALLGFNSSKVGRIQLSNPDLAISMIIHGQPQAYHIGICENDTKFYYYWNGSEPNGETVDIAWNTFDSHQICNDYNILVIIVKYFYETGELLKDVLWENEILEG